MGGRSEEKRQRAEGQELSYESVKSEENYNFDELMKLYGDDFRNLDRLKLSRTPSHELGHVLLRLGREDQVNFLKKLSDSVIGEILPTLASEDSAEVLAQLKDMRALRILSLLEPDDAAYVVRCLDAEDQDRLLGKLPMEAAETIYDLLSYDKDTAGGVMTPNVGWARADWAVDEVFQKFRSGEPEKENLDVVYAVDEHGRLVGSVTLHRLIRASGEQRIGQILDGDRHLACNADDPTSLVAQVMMESNRQSVPIVDHLGRLIGIVTSDDVIDLLKDNATRDIQVLHGAGAEENIHDPVHYSVAKRNPWLIFNLFTASLGALVVSFFQTQIEQLTLLAVFMTLVTSLGGNSGGQTLAVAIRSLALGEWRRGDTRGVFLRETLKGLCNGVIIGIVAAVAGACLTHNLRVGLALFFSMIINLATCGLAGALIPYCLQKLKFDPAQSAYVVLTMITDTVGMYVFLRIGCWLLL
ncbi:MAG: magnesium transporter [Puniceicoccales bacterium]|jgi:magnesium transporter|nr:magnesium transporter [Puniceicoccales bacterium]